MYILYLKRTSLRKDRKAVKRDIVTQGIPGVSLGQLTSLTLCQTLRAPTDQAIPVSSEILLHCVAIILQFHY